jgi:hypothetical protein
MEEGKMKNEEYNRLVQGECGRRSAFLLKKRRNEPQGSCESGERRNGVRSHHGKNEKKSKEDGDDATMIFEDGMRWQKDASLLRAAEENWILLVTKRNGGREKCRLAFGVEKQQTNPFSRGSRMTEKKRNVKQDR